MPKSIAQPGGGTPQQIVTAAAEVIATEGWAAVSTRAIAARAGINPALVHYHFGSVDAVAIEALEQAMASEAQRAIAVVLAPEDLTTGLRDFGRWLASRSDTVTQRRIIVEGLSQATLRDDVRSFLMGALTDFRSAIAARLPKSMANPESVAALIAATLDGIAIHAMVDPDLDPTRLTDALSDAVRQLALQEAP